MRKGRGDMRVFNSGQSPCRIGFRIDNLLQVLRGSLRLRVVLFPCVLCWLVALIGLTVPAEGSEGSVSFNRDIRPILSDRCFACHGPDAESVAADLRLDLAEAAVENVIVPGDASNSELVRRIFSTDEDEVMPPAELHKPLTDSQKELLKKWIDQGAEYSQHWAYVPLKRDRVLDTQTQKEAKGWGVNGIDRLVAQEHAKQRVSPAEPADPITLLRRLSFDLTGLPPTPEEAQAFLSDQSEEGYQAVVDRLLDSPRYGERMAIYWLDLVRYADTVGYHGDQDVSVSPYRDYVIDAFNRNLPFDQFVREQLAGDLLPNPSTRQLVASGYNRMNQTTEEGGAQPKEYLAIYFADRVRNVSQVFMGATVGCAQCHDHKYDPYTAKDFYALGAFFADLEEVGKYDARQRPPEIAVPTDAEQQRLEMLDQQIESATRALENYAASMKPTQSEWELALLEKSDAEEKTEDGSDSPQLDSKIASSAEKLPEDVAKALQVASDDRKAEDRKLIRDYFFSTDPKSAGLLESQNQLLKTRQEVAEQIATTVISRSVAPREIRILHRGNWMDESGEVVQPAIPEFLGSLKTEGRASRLDLANWLCAEDNGLTARTLANRLWFLMFGRGICTSVDDLGGQGTFPSQPELLDYLAVELVQSGWDIKHVLRLIANSATYRQSSLATADVMAADPYNAWFARQGRFRIGAELVRDNALFVSGLLVEQVGGKSVKPYQPEDYYAQLNFPRRNYVADSGDAQYRRGVYTHWQRTFLHPMLKAFDAPSREECTARRARSNTPLQSLTLLNDPTFVEAARVFAQRTMREGGASVAERIQWAYRAALLREAEPFVVEQLRSVYDSHLAHFRANQADASEFVSVGNSPVDEGLISGERGASELAAWTSVTRVILNLTETITRY